MDFTLALYSGQNREGRLGGEGWGGELRDLWPSNLHFEQGHCFWLTCRMSKCLFKKEKKKRNSMDSLYQIFFSLVTVQPFQRTLTIHACIAWSYHKDFTINGNPFGFVTYSPMKTCTHAIICTHARPWCPSAQSVIWQWWHACQMFTAVLFYRQTTFLWECQIIIQ